MKKYFTKFLDLIKSHKKISVAVLLVLVFCLVGGIWLVQTRSRNKAVLAEQSSAEKGELSVKSDSKEKNKKVDSSEDSKDEKTKNSGEETEQKAAEATENTPAPTDSSTTPAETSKTSVKSSSNSSAKTSFGQKGSAQKPSTSKSGSAPTQKTQSSSQTVKPIQPTQPAQPAKPSGHYETRQVLVSAAYDEPVYETQVVGVKCNTCGQVFSTFEAWEAHSDSMIDQGDTNHMSYSGVYGQVQTGTKHHDAVYKTQQVWVQD